MLIPRNQIQFRRDEQGRCTAFSPMLPGCEAGAQNEQLAVRALQRAAHARLRALRDAGEPIPEAFAHTFRRNVQLAAALGIGLVLLVGIAVALLRPPSRKTAYENLLPAITMPEVKTLLGAPDEVIDLRQHEGYLSLKQAGIVTLWQYGHIDDVGSVELAFDHAGMMVSKRSLEGGESESRPVKPPSAF